MGSLYNASEEVAVTSGGSAKAKSALAVFEARTAQKLKALVEKEEALKKVQIQQADVDFLEREFGWQKSLAERILRLEGGNLKAMRSKQTR